MPNDTELDCRDNRLALITGPNMAGKSTYMRQVALIVLMAQIGSFVPAKYAKVGIVDKLFTRVGASDDLSRGQSTFMLEMSEVSYILKNATKKSLILYDEIGRGTSTYDGMSIARAVAEYTASKKLGAKTLFATHYHELTALEDELPGIVNYNIAAKKRGENHNIPEKDRARTDGRQLRNRRRAPCGCARFRYQTRTGRYSPLLNREMLRARRRADMRQTSHRKNAETTFRFPSRIWRRTIS